MKKWGAWILALVLMISCLTGCSSKKEDEEAFNDVQVSEREETENEQEEIENSTPIKVEQEETEQTPSKQTDTETSQKNSTEEPDKEETSSKEEKQPAEEKKDEQTETKEPEQDEVQLNSGDTLKIVSYNIRYTDDPNGNSIAERGPRLKTVLESYDPDIIGFQEVVPQWTTLLDGYLGDRYTSYLMYRSKTNLEGTPVYYKTDKFECLDKGYFWLSTTPEEESKSWGGLPRICLWLHLKVKATGTEFLYVNTHFDGTNASVGSAQLIIKRVKALGGFSKYPVLCSADYNFTPWSEGYTAMMDAFDDVNAELENSQQTTVGGYEDQAGVDGKIIDFVFYSRGMGTPLKYEVITQKVNGGSISDHHGLYVEFNVGS